MSGQILSGETHFFFVALESLLRVCDQNFLRVEIQTEYGLIKQTGKSLICNRDICSETCQFRQINKNIFFKFLQMYVRLHVVCYHFV